MAAAPGGWRAAGGRRRRAGGEAAGAGAVLRRLREARDDLLSSGFWEASAGAVRAPLGSSAEPPAHCVCYGLGRFSVCPAARHQLAFLLLLLEELGVPPGRCALFDPAFSAQEADALRELGLRLLPENEEGKHDVEGSATLFYMVHCGKALYNNLLWRNWSAGALAKMVIIGNSFKGIEERLLSRILERDYSYIAKVLKGTEEVALPTHPRYLDTFNDTSIHWFPLQKLKELSPEVWEFMEEPMYQDCDDLEIIRKEDRTDRHSPTATES
ncbi:SRR1-like protein isoform X3 [Falco peregrinus]|uniref:SRR1-like protein isoform X3 n=1 Tax=Falco peregrinus TaxID=8954 RepID=UPI0024792ACB|nr:SRR1-like protein isoform X3 [Falco peregrinus]